MCQKLRLVKRPFRTRSKQCDFLWPIERQCIKSTSFLGNLHAGNIFIGSDGSPIISETENYFNGSTSILRPFIVQLKGPCSSAEAMDVYCFGHFLFEMATGSPLQNPTCDNALPSQMPDQLSKFQLFWYFITPQNWENKFLIGKTLTDT